jgi:hypothetical protein
MRGTGATACALTLLVFGNFMASPVYADSTPPTSETSLNQGLHETGHAIARGAHSAGHAISNGAHAVGHAFERGAQHVRHAFGGTGTHEGSRGGATNVPAPPKLAP